MDSLISVHTSVVLSLLVASKEFNVTPTYLVHNTIIHYSEAVILHWSDFISDCDQGECTQTLGDILQFISGSSKLPDSGFNTYPSIKFTDESRLPQVSTCDVPFPEFKQQRNFALCNSFGFGQP